MSLRGRLARWWAHQHGRRYGATMITASGIEWHPLDPDPNAVLVEDLARGLANCCRYNGHTSIDLDPDAAYYSVAEHSTLVSIVVEQRARTAGWSEADVVAVAGEGHCHDGNEAYIGDMIRPLKYTPEMSEFRRIEDLNQRAIHTAMGLHPTPRSERLVKLVDDAILCDETCLRKGVDAARYARRYGPPLGVHIVGMDPETAEAFWLERFVELWKRGAFPAFEPEMCAWFKRAEGA